MSPAEVVVMNVIPVHGPMHLTFRMMNAAPLGKLWYAETMVRQ